MAQDLTTKSWYKWAVVTLLWVVALLNYLDRQMISTMKPSMMMDIKELEQAENFGRIMGVFLLIYGLMSPITGIIADRVNRKWLIVGSLFVWSAATYSMGFADTYDGVYYLRALMGLSEALYLATALAMIADFHTSKTRSLAVGIHMSGLYAGQALGGFGATIAHYFSWHTVFHWFGIAGIVYAIFLVFTLFDVDRKSKVTTSDNISQTEKLPLLKSLGIIFGTLSFWILLFYFMASSFPGWATKNWLPMLFCNNLHVDMASAGPMATISTAIASFVGVVIGGPLSDRWVQKNIKGRIYTSTIGLALIIPALVLMGFGSSYVSMIGATLLFGIGYGMFDTNNMPILCQILPQQLRATAYGIMNMVGVFAGYAITVMLGSSTDKGNLGADFSTLSIIVLIAIVLILVFAKPKRELCGE